MKYLISIIMAAFIMSGLSFASPAQAAPVATASPVASSPVSGLSVAPSAVVTSMVNARCTKVLRSTGNSPWISYRDKDGIRNYARVYFKDCRQGYTRWARLVSYTVGFSGKARACGAVDPFDGATFNGYFWDITGRNWNPGPKRLGCRTSGKHENTYAAGSAPKLLFKTQYRPRWRFTVTNHWDWLIPDDHGQLFGYMRWVEPPK